MLCTPLAENRQYVTVCQMLKEGKLRRKDLRTSAKRVLELILKLA